jgi:WD40-like Beta Propeller Repeat
VYIQQRNIDNPTEVEVYPPFKHFDEYVWVDVVDGVAEFDTHPTVLPLFNPLIPEKSKKITVNGGLGDTADTSKQFEIDLPNSPVWSKEGKTQIVRWNPANPDRFSAFNIPTTPTKALRKREYSLDRKTVLWIFEDFKNAETSVYIGNPTFSNARFLGIMSGIRRNKEGQLEHVSTGWPILSPDGKRIAFEYDRAIYVVKL